MKHCLFILRHANDLDHITPVIWKWTMVPDQSAIALFPWGLPVQENDFRIQIINSIENCQTLVLSKEKLKQCSQAELIKLFENAIQPEIDNVIVFDWLHRGMNEEIRLAKVIIDWAHQKKIPVVSLPHGDHCHAGEMMHTGSINPTKADVYAPIKLFDALVTPNEHCGTRYLKHIYPNKPHVLGSPRFNKEWLSYIQNRQPEFKIDSAIEKVKIALFLRHKGYPIFWEEIYWTIRLITQFENIHLVVVPHTRLTNLDEIILTYPELLSNIDNLTYTTDTIYSGSITRWADVVLDIGTSMSFEMVQLGKNLICPEYLHATRSLTSLYFPDTIALCRDELYEKITLLSKDIHYRFYTEEERKKFIDEIIQPKGDDVLKHYNDFLRAPVILSESAYIETSNTSKEKSDLNDYPPIPLITKYTGLLKALHEKEEYISKKEIDILAKNSEIAELNQRLIHKRHLIEKLEQKFKRILKSHSYQIGKIITLPARIMMRKPKSK